MSSLLSSLHSALLRSINDFAFFRLCLFHIFHFNSFQYIPFWFTPSLIFRSPFMFIYYPSFFSFVHLFIHSLNHACAHSFVQPLIDLLLPWLVHTIIRTPRCSLICSLIRSLIHLTLLFTSLFAQLLTQYSFLLAAKQTARQVYAH